MQTHRERPIAGDKPGRPVTLALLAAALYSLSAPASKLLLVVIPPTLLAALLYLGAGLGMLAVNLVGAQQRQARTEARITRKDAPYVVAMIVLDIAAPILLMLGLGRTTAATASLLNNAEIVATAVIALVAFHEAVGRRMWLAIVLITLASIVLSLQDVRNLSFSTGALLVLLACVCWGLENNCTRMLSLKDPLQIVVVKGLGSGLGSLCIALALKEGHAPTGYVLLALLLGFCAYGMSIYSYILAQRALGAARTSAYYAAAPFIGVLLSWVVLREELTWSFGLALALMVAGAILAITEQHSHQHTHLVETHEHKHNHRDGHHNHVHPTAIAGEHSHVHTHEALTHTHMHWPDLHHRHSHH